MVAIVDYEMGNIGSIFNMLKYLGIKSYIAKDPIALAQASKIILPGVGSFDTAMSAIHQKGFLEVIHQKALHEQVPLLGICLGMQLLMQSSQEGELEGLGFIQGKALAFRGLIDQGLRVPHMGWNLISGKQVSLLSDGIEVGDRFYFAHSFCVQVDDVSSCVMQTHYGVDFDSAVAKDNIFGVQFHPEKSHKYGMKLLNNFCRLS